MSWRGRPLTSHEVVVKTIAATRTSGGLRVEAALDPGDYPTGVAISTERLDALPLERHAVHGSWNYTLHPQPASCCTEAVHVGAPGSPAQRRQAMLQQLADLRLTGMTSTQLERLVATLAPAQAARAQQRHSQQRGGPRQSGTRSGVFHQKISNHERVLLAVLYQRRLCTMDVLADLLDVSRSSIGNTIREIRPLLEQAGHTSTPAPTRSRSAAELLAPVTLPTTPNDTHIPTS